ncbi:MAG: MnhB domain-containing protein [Candidatus Hadarchaeales archaeon]
MSGMSLITKTITRLLLPFIALFGAYMVAHGHLSPGGGFPGGVIIASAFVAVILAYGLSGTKKEIVMMRAEALESIGGISIVVLGLLGISLSMSFLQNVFPLGWIGDIFSGGIIPFLYLGVGIKVTAGILLIFYSMLFALGEE